MEQQPERGLWPPRDALMLGGILLVALVVRVIAWQRTAVLFNDGPIFLAMAEAIGRGDWAQVLVHPYHPLYPALIRGVAMMPLGLEAAGVAVSIAGGLLSVIALFVFTRFAFDRELAWLAAWVVALHPWAVDFSSDVMSDGLYAGFYLVAFAAMARAVMRPTVSSSALCGVASGLAYLVRPEGIGLLFIGLLLLVVRAIAEPAIRRRIVVVGIVLAVAATVVMSPFVLEVGRETGDLALTHKKSIASLVSGSSAEPARDAAKDRAAPSARPVGSSQPLPLPVSAIRSDGRGERKPPHDGFGLIEAIGRMLSTSLSAIRYDVVVFALIGLWATRSRHDVWREATIGLPILCYSALLVILVWGAGYVSRRHALAPWLPAIAFSAAGWRFGCSKLADGARARGWIRWARLGAPRFTCLALVLVLALSWGARDLRARRQDRAPVRAAGEWLAQHYPDSGPVAAQKRRTAYYAGAPFVPLASGHDGRLERNLIRRGVRWVVIDQAKLADHVGLEAGLGHWLRAIHEIPSDPAPILILALEPEPAS